MDARSLEVRPGEAIEPAWRRLQAWVKSLRMVQGGDGLRVHRGANQTTVVADLRTASFKGAFAVRLAGTEATIGEGTVEGMAPSINGVLISDPSPPVLAIAGPPNAALRSWIALRADPGKDGLLDPENKAALTLIHTNDLSEPGLHAVAMIIWSDKSIVARFRQILYFDQSYLFVPATPTSPARHLFSAAA